MSEQESPFDICKNCQHQRSQHVAKFVETAIGGTASYWGCSHFEKAEPSHVVRKIPALPQPNVPMGNHPTHTIKEIKKVVEDACSGRDSQVISDMLDQFAGVAPLLVQLRLERRVAEDAAMWWKVRDWCSKNSGFTSREIGEYVVQLIERGGR